MAAGRVTLAAGAPAAHRPVMLVAWPSNDVTDRMVQGDRVTLQPVARTTTDADGRFALRLVDNRALAPFAGTDRLINLEVVSTTASPTAQSTSRASLPAPASAERVQMSVLDPAGSRDAQATEATDPEGANDTAQNAPVTMKGCSTRLVKNYGIKRVLIGQHYSSASYVTTDFVYSRGANSTLGVGYSASGKFGTFSQSGTMSKSSSAVEDYHAVHGKTSAYRYMWFRYGKYHIDCTFGAGYSYWYEVRTTAWAGGADTRYPAAVSASKCVKQERGSAFTKSTTRAVNWTNGADLSSTIGIDLSVRTGYSSDAKVKFVFNRVRRLCGTGGYPAGDHPYQLRAKMPA